MRIHRLSLFLTLLGIVASTPCLAAEIQRLHIDLDGDKKPEIIRISTAPAAEDWRKRFIVRIGASKYTNDFFSADGDLPDVRVVYIDRNRSQHQLLIGTPEAGSCIFHLLAYSPKKLIPLLRFDSGPNCRPPQPLGNGKVSVTTWQGFWHQNETYHLSKDGEVLLAESQDIYDVRVSGAAGKSLVLQGAQCASREVAPGMFIRVKLFDAKQDRYFLESADGGCGWIPASKLDTIDDTVKELPWAG